MANIGFSPITQHQQLAEEPVIKAWAEYTGVPSAVMGGIGFVAGQLGMQGVQARIGMHYGVYGKGQTFKGALAIEFIGGTIVLATLATLIDPQHKVEGFGLDETKFYKKHLEGKWTGFKSKASESWGTARLTTPRGKWIA